MMEFVKEIEMDIWEMKTNIGGKIMIVGDLNAHMGNDEEGIKDNHEEIGIRGKEYRRMIKQNDLVLVNNTKKCRGKWTRIEGDKKAILDLTISTPELYKDIKEVEIDEDEKYSIESKRSKTDHKISIIKIKCEEKRIKEKKKVTICNRDWEKFNRKLQQEMEGKDLNELRYIDIENMIKIATKEITEEKRIRKEQKQQRSKQTYYQFSTGY